MSGPGPARAALAAAVLLLAAPGARAAVDVFSPGELARPHEALSGIANCTKCHPAGGQLSRERCAACHRETGDRMTRGLGLHGRIEERERDCWRCHRDHLGSDYPLVDWGKEGRERFDHARSGWPLLGKHAKVACEKCHDPKLVTDPAVLEVVKKGRRSWLGAPVACAPCHKDPHENRLGADCERCHGADGWSVLVGAAKDDRAWHDRTRYALRGKHAEVACAPCHGPWPPAPARWRGLPFAACADCHPDAHVGQLAEPRCERCHGVEGFAPARYGVEEHAKSRYPLEGAHLAVACVRCHPDDARVAARVPEETLAALGAQGRKPRFSKALLAVAGDLARCETCHADPHRGQLAARPCSACHELSSFTKIRFDHQKDSRYPLDGKHAKAGCGACHRAEAGVVRWRPLPLACEGCHADPHAGTLAAAGGEPRCDRCHGTGTWKELRFRHEPPFTEYRLTGKHAKARCERCHPQAGGDPAARRWRGVPQACIGCHLDPHRGAFAAVAEGKGERCEVCHGVDGWEARPFAHEKTAFPLLGAHRDARCRACHGGELERRLPRACAGCHRDPHEARLGACDRCHRAEDRTWRAAFDVADHRRTDFPLEGRHALLPCEECHGDRVQPGFSRPTPRCAACHGADRVRATWVSAVDHLAPGFPPRCDRCHDAWGFGGAAFPEHQRCFNIASGKHAGHRCLACHTTLAGVPFPGSGACDTGTASCTRCHEDPGTEDLRVQGARR